MALACIWCRGDKPREVGEELRHHLEELGIFPLGGNREPLKVINRSDLHFREMMMV